MEEPRQRHAARMRASTWREAAKLLAEAGWTPKDGVLTNAKGDGAHGRVPARAARLRAHRAALQGGAGQARHQGQRAHRRHLAVSAPARHLRLRHHRRDLPAVAVARQRAARLLGLGGGRQGRQPQSHRHQEPGRRQADRQDHPGQGPRRSGGRHPRARPRAAVEPLRRAAMARALRAHGDLGHVSAGRTSCPRATARFLRVWWYDEAAAKRLADARG